MNKYEIRYRLEGEPAYRKTVLELPPDMGLAIKSGYELAKGMHGIPVTSFQVRALATNR